MDFTLKIALGNDTCSNLNDVAYYLEELASDIRAKPAEKGTIMDLCGNAVGAWHIDNARTLDDYLCSHPPSVLTYWLQDNDECEYLDLLDETIEDVGLTCDECRLLDLRGTPSSSGFGWWWNGEGNLRDANGQLVSRLFVE